MMSSADDVVTPQPEAEAPVPAAVPATEPAAEPAMSPTTPAPAADTPVVVTADGETPAPATAPLSESVTEQQVVEAVAAEPEEKPGHKKDDGRARGVGRRKTAVARAMLKPGTGKLVVNKRDPKEYFRRLKLTDEIHQPFVAIGMVDRFDVSVVVFGSSLSSQAGAVRLSIARALADWEPEYRPVLSTAGLLTRDPRMVERKKYGIRGARRRPQWTKR